MTRLAWAELDRGAVVEALGQGAAVALPLGAVEQHGLHLPTGTDYLTAEHVVVRAAQDARGAVVTLPPVPFGLSHFHMRWGATIGLGADTVSKVLADIATSVKACGAKRFFIVNGHGGNRGICTTISLQMSEPGFSVHAFSYWDVAAKSAQALFSTDHGSLGHAGQAETSIIAALRPELCHPERVIGHEPIKPPIGVTAIERLGESGVSGDPSAGTAELGGRFLDEVVRRLIDLFDGSANFAPGQPGS